MADLVRVLLRDIKLILLLIVEPSSRLPTTKLLLVLLLSILFMSVFHPRLFYEGGIMVTLVVLYVLLIASSVLLIRNLQVALYRSSLRDTVAQQSHIDVLCGRDYKWRFQELEKVNYSDMVFSFWRKLDSFYPDKSFTQ
jgi:hypothetical protein